MTTPNDHGEGLQFTPRAQQVLALARKEADRFSHEFIGTEHVLLGLVRLGQGVAVSVLVKMGVNLENVRQEVERQIGVGPKPQTHGNIPYTPRVKRVLALASREARTLNHIYVGPEHILMGLIQEGDGVAARVLANLGVETHRTRQEILKELDPNFTPAEAVTAQTAESKGLQSDEIDVSKRYDIYCVEKDRGIVVYRNALFKGRRRLLPRRDHDPFCEYLELEQADGQTIFIARSWIIKFCEPGVKPSSEPV
jgi:ATP-dependent Clp protease ATP-binding subunit ClpA